MLEGVRCEGHELVGKEHCVLRIISTPLATLAGNLKIIVNHVNFQLLAVVLEFGFIGLVNCIWRPSLNIIHNEPFAY